MLVRAPMVMGVSGLSPRMVAENQMEVWGWRMTLPIMEAVGAIQVVGEILGM